MDDDRLWSVRELADYFQLDEKTIRKYITAGDLPAIRMGKQTNGVPYRVANAEVNRFKKVHLVSGKPRVGRPRAGEKGESA